LKVNTHTIPGKVSQSRHHHIIIEVWSSEPNY